MKELIILSGKGGTGKTSLTAAFAALAENTVFCDADVDAADLHLILTPEIKSAMEFKGANKAVIDSEKCSQCGQCLDLCRFEAVTADLKIDPLACEGCGVCVDLCPEHAIAFPQSVCGEWFVSGTRFGTLVHGRLGIAQENSGKLVALIRQQAKKTAQQENCNFILTDGPPGIGCPVIASISQATAVLIIAEPTVSGRHDMERVSLLARHFNVPAMVCINKYDLNPEQTEKIEAFALDNHLSIAGRISFNPIFVQAMIQAQTLFEYNRMSSAAMEVQTVWENVQAFLSAMNPPVFNNNRHLQEH
jgi:MinD superfamily P-loop ATPase